MTDESLYKSCWNNRDVSDTVNLEEREPTKTLPEAMENYNL